MFLECKQEATRSIKKFNDTWERIKANIMQLVRCITNVFQVMYKYCLGFYYITLISFIIILYLIRSLGNDCGAAREGRRKKVDHTKSNYAHSVLLYLFIY
jgi:hypothetical protein